MNTNQKIVQANMVQIDKSNMFRTKSTKTGDFIVAAFCVFLIVIYLAPFINIISRSLSSPNALVNNRVSFWPVEPALDSYAYVLSDTAFSRSIVLTAILTVVCTVFSMLMTILAAYPLTYDLKGGKAINIIIILTMYFSAGTIPNYLLMKQLNLLGSPLVLVLPGCLSVFNMIILRSFFWGIPESLRESAELDGAGPFTVLVNIYLPLSGPVLATLALFYAVGRWNGFSDALMYLPDPKYHPVQLKLYQIINNRSSIEISTLEGFSTPTATEGLKAASVMFATVPILVVYPWLQRYFITGVTIGAVKG